METKKIRIGNDIRLAVDLRQYIDKGYLRERDVYMPGDEEFEDLDTNPFVNKNREVYHPNQYTDQNGAHIEFKPEGTPISIRSVKAFIINTTREAERERDLRNKTRFISRFPIEPHMDAYLSTPYDICSSGYPTWRAYPHCHYIPTYTGFGLHPCWDGIYKPLPRPNDTEFVAPVCATEKQHVVEVSFPARAQLYTGVYKLVVVAELFAPGFNTHNLKTITVDVPNVFELVKSTEEGIDTGILVNVAGVTDVLPSGDENNGVTYNDIYVNEGNYSEDNIVLDRTDGSTVNVDLSRITRWYEGD